MNGLLESLGRLGPTRLLVMGILGAALLAAFFVLAQRVGAPKMALLYGDLSVEDSSEIISQLESQGVPFELEGQGQRILVPSDQALRLRLAMAREGLPAGGSVGYELFDKGEGIGTTSFIQNINRLRALEGELSRTIRTIDRVAAARVHLVLPRRDVFARERRKSSASITIRMGGSSRLDAGQVRAMQHLVAAAVPDLEPERVSIVDDRGQLLSRGADGATMGATGLADARAAEEGWLKEAIESLVEHSVGVGRVRAEVSVDTDLDRVTINQELYDPESQVVRSTQTLEENSASTEKEADKTVTVANNLPEGQSKQVVGPGSESNSQRTEETVNYEISKTTKTQIHESGLIKRVSVAVLVDGTYAAGGDGEIVYAPRESAELEKIATLVKSAIGFDAKRGDTVEIVNLRFQRLLEPLEESNAATEFIGFGMGDVFRAAEMLALVVVALLVVLFVGRPLLSALLSSSSPRAEPATAPRRADRDRRPAGGRGGRARDRPRGNHRRRRGRRAGPGGGAAAAHRRSSIRPRGEREDDRHRPDRRPSACLLGTQDRGAGGSTPRRGAPDPAHLDVSGNLGERDGGRTSATGVERSRQGRGADVGAG